jgi:AAA15 family ATPase/GTPase
MSEKFITSLNNDENSEPNLNTVESLSPEEEKPSNDEVVKRVSDIKTYMDGFKNSSEYKESFNKYYEGKNLASDITEEELIETFDASENARQSLIAYARNNNILLKYDPDQYSDEFRENFKEYTNLLREIRKGRILDRDSIISIDQMRSTYHMQSAKSLVRQGITGSSKIARGIVEILVIERGLENFSNVEISESEKLRWQLTGSRGW